MKPRPCSMCGKKLKADKPDKTTKPDKTMCRSCAEDFARLLGASVLDMHPSWYEKPKGSEA